MDDSRRLRAEGLDAEPALAGATAAKPQPGAPARPPTDLKAPDIEHTVWNEPSLVASGATAPDGQLTYARWLDAESARFTWAQSFWVTVGLALVAGPFGVLGAFVSGPSSGLSAFGLLAVVVVGPVTEEITKIAGALWVVEKRPYWFKSMLQVLLCAGAGGLAFAAIENLIYIYLYNPGGGAEFRAWRWTICTALHVNCSMIAGWGLVRIWHKAISTRTRPELRLGMPLFALAMITHGLYNLSVTVAEVAGWLEFD